MKESDSLVSSRKNSNGANSNSNSNGNSNSNSNGSSNYTYSAVGLEEGAISSSDLHVPTGWRSSSPRRSSSSERNPLDDDDEAALLSSSSCGHSWLSENYKTIALGGLDGASVAFIIVTAAYGMGLRYIYTFVLGLSVIIGCSFYVLINEFLASKATKDYLETERRLNGIRFLNEKSDDISLMNKAFVDRGMPHTEAESIVQSLSQYNNLFVDIKMALKFGQNSDVIDSDPNLFFESFLMQLSYLVAGLLVLFTYLIPTIMTPSAGAAVISVQYLYIICCCVLTVIVCTISSMKRTFTYNSWISCFLESSITIVIPSAAAYLVSAEMVILLDKYMSSSDKIIS